MFTEERKQLILDMLASEGRASVGKLAARLNVSDDTIRRDLNALAENGFLQKVHGGAVVLAIAQIARSKRAQLLPETKVRLGKAVAKRLKAGQRVIIDSGTTTLEIARSLPDLPLTIITNSLDIANCLSARPSIDLIFAGGHWDSEQRLFYGANTINTLNTYRADLSILGACAIDTKFGVTASSEADAEVKRAMLKASAIKLIVADHSKFNQQELYFVADLSEFDEVYTDKRVAVLGKRPLVHVVKEDKNG